MAERCEPESFRIWREWVATPSNSPEALAPACGVAAEDLRGAARLYARKGNSAIYYGLGVTEHAQGSTMVMGIANLAMATGNVGRPGVGVNPLRGQNNVQGACDMGSFPHELPGYRHISDASVRASFDAAWGVTLQAEPGLRIPNMFDAALDGQLQGPLLPGRGFRPVGSEYPARDRGDGGDGARRRPGHLPERDRAIRPRLPARLFLPRKGRHLHQRRTAHLARAPRDAAALRPGGLGGHLRALECPRLSDGLRPSK